MMEDISVLQKSGRIIDKKVRSNFNSLKNSSEGVKTNSILNNLNVENDENFLNYINWHGHANESNLLVLPSSLHYYYDIEDLKGVTTLIHMKKLNLIKHLDDFLHTVSNVLSPKTKFIGCFSDRKTQNGIGVPSKIYKKFINFLDARIDKEIDKKDITRLLESLGFKIIDMTEISGLTYFITQYNGKAVA